MKKNILILIFLYTALFAVAQDFEKYFTDSTLRLDYTFAGDFSKQDIYLDRLNTMPGWYGKRQHLSELPIEGNGQIIIRDNKSKAVIYRNSFSTLFQEWLSYDEAKELRRSFENIFLVPFPKDTIDVTVQLRNNRREVVTEMTHQVVPTDILIRKIGQKPTPYETLLPATDTTKCINIAFVAEGYTESEMETYLDDCYVAMDAIFSHEPFKACKDRFNIVAVKSISEESGTSEPMNKIWKRTALGSHFDTFYSDRYLTTLNLRELHDILAGTPYEHIIVLVNTEKYGGGGILNSYNLSMTHHQMFRSVVVHEFGHSFAGLADEYAYETEEIPMYPHDIEPWEENITTLVNFEAKWQDMMNKDSVKLYEGAGYSPKGVFRPCQDCRMRTNTNPEFCPVCRRALQRVIDFYTK